MILFLFLLSASVFADDLMIEKITGNASDIQLIRPDGWKQVPAVGARAPQGSRVLTGSEAAVQARLPDGSSVTLGRESEAAFHVLGVNQTEISLDQGRARATVPKATSPGGPRRFRIKTKAATMGVRGTDFTVELAGERAGVHVFEGSVEVTRPTAKEASYTLEPNQALEIGPKHSPTDRPHSFDPAKFLQEWERGAIPEELHWWQRLWRWLMGLVA